MHDGSLATLDDVISFYEQVGRSIETRATDSIQPVLNSRSNKLASFHLTREEKHDLIAFLHTLTDSLFLQKTSGNTHVIN
jgi:cytochrome c peroxidase